MKVVKNAHLWLEKAASCLSYTELRVFIFWFNDAPGFSACASELHRRIPNISRQNIERALKGIVAKGLIVKTGMRPNSRGGKASPVYHLNPKALSDSNSLEAVTQDAQANDSGESLCNDSDFETNDYEESHIPSKQPSKEPIKKPSNEKFDSSNSSTIQEEKEFSLGNDPSIEPELLSLANALINKGVFSLLCKKLFFVAKHDTAPPTNPKYQSNNVIAKRHLKTLLNGGSLDSTALKFVDRTYTYNAKKLNIESIELKKNESIIPNVPWLDRSKLKGPAPVTVIDESIDIFGGAFDDDQETSAS